MCDPAISVIVPVYNAEKYLPQCLNSILNQTFSNIQIICVDDGSTDDSMRILREYESFDNRLLVLSHNNSGAGISRNKGIECSTGEYIHFMDADDYLEPGAYDSMYNTAVKYNADMVKTRVNGFDDETGVRVNNPWYDLGSLSSRDFNRVTNFYEMPDKFTKILVAPWNGIYKSSLIKDKHIRFNSLVCVNDRSFYNQVMLNAQRVVFLKNRTINYRINIPGSLVGRRAENFDCHFESFKIITGQCAHLQPNLQAIILNSELEDIFNWFRIYKADERYGYIITQRFKSFLSELDFKHIIKYCKEIKWLNDYTELKYPIAVSVIVAVYNGESYLRECLDTLVNQSLRNIEIICVNDGSLDRSPDILEEYKERDKRFDIINQDNSGPGLARNAGLMNAAGKYLFFMDSDDIMEPDMLSKLFYRAESNCSDIVVCHSDQFADGTGQRIPWSWALNDALVPPKQPFTRQGLGLDIFKFTMGWAWDKLFASSLIKDNNIIFPSLKNSEDLMFVFPAIVLASGISTVKEVLIHHRISRSTSVSNSRNQDPLCFLQSSVMFKDFLVKNNFYSGKIKQGYINWALSYALWNLNTITGDAYLRVYTALRAYGFEQLDILTHDSKYFTSPKDVDQLKEILNNSNPQLPTDSSKEQLTSAKIKSPSKGDSLIKRIFSYLSSKIIRGYQCYKDHGLGYTARLAKSKFLNIFKINL